VMRKDILEGKELTYCLSSSDPLREGRGVMGLTTKEVDVVACLLDKGQI
jgi:hypothetical protein